MKRLFLSLFTIVLFSLSLYAQTDFEGKVRLDRTVYDFGEVLVGSGKLECTYTLTNISNAEFTIYNVISSCGCTAASWTREPVPAGGKGVIKAVFDNEDGPLPFDKTLTVYVSTLARPFVLRLKGVVQEKPRPLAESYPEHLGSLGLRSTDIKVGNLSQGEQKGGEVMVANIGTSPLKISFKDVSKGLSVRTEPEVIPAGKTGKLVYTVTAMRTLWGKNYYYATAVAGGKTLGKISFWAFTKENFSAMSKQEQKNGSLPFFDKTNSEFSGVEAGAKVKATFKLTNKGKQDLIIYKEDFDEAHVKCTRKPGTLKPGQSGTYEFEFDTKGIYPGDVTQYITLTTNSPLRPFLDLFIVGKVR